MHIYNAGGLLEKRKKRSSLQEDSLAAGSEAYEEIVESDIDDDPGTLVLEAEVCRWL